MKANLKTFILLNFVSVASVSSAMITPALPQIQSYFNLQHGLLEWIITIFLIGYMVGQLIYAPLANRYGRLNALRFGLYGNLVGIFICVLSYYTHSYPLMLTGRSISALGASSGLVCTFILINESLPVAQAKRAISFALISFTVGIAAAVFIGGFVTQYLGWQYCFAFLLGHGLLLLGASYFLDETLPKCQRQSLNLGGMLHSYAVGFGNKKLVMFSLVVGLNAVFSYAFSAAAPLISHSYLQITTSEYGMWNLVNMAGMFSGSLLAARLLKNNSGMKVMTLGFYIVFAGIISLVAMAVLSGSSSLWFFITTAVMYASAGLIYSSASYYASNAIRDKATASGVMNFINMGSSVVAVGVMGYLPFDALLGFIGVVTTFTLIGFVMKILQSDHQEPVNGIAKTA